MSTNEALQINAGDRAESTENQPWMLDTPEYLLILVFAVIAWTPGFIELLNVTSQNPVILDFYSPPRFFGLVAYTAIFPVLLVLMFLPSARRWLSQIIVFIQDRAWLTVPLLAFMVTAMWLLVTSDPEIGLRLMQRLSWFPFLRLTLFGWLLLTSALLLFAAWGKTGPAPLWRKAIVWLLGLLVIVEIVLQIVAWAGWLPGPHQVERLYPPYGKLYQNAEGMVNGSANSYGLNYPDVAPRENATRVLLLGDTFVQALQIDGEDHLGVTLASLANETMPENAIDVQALGFPGFGPGLYLSDYHVEEITKEFQPDEIILFFHLANDFQYTSVPTQDDVVYHEGQDGRVIVHPDGKDFLHNLTHFIIPAYRRNLDPLVALKSYYLTPSLLTPMSSLDNPSGDLLDIPAVRGRILDQVEEGNGFSAIRRVGLSTAPGLSNFLFEVEPSTPAETAFEIAEALLKQTDEYLDSENVQLRVVTIPAFPPGFYAENTGAQWTPALASYDLFGPERVLQTFAAENGIPFLPLGQTLQQEGLSVEEIQAIFFNDGVGHFTKRGHEYVANAIHRCFYASDDPSISGCRLEQ